RRLDPRRQRSPVERRAELAEILVAVGDLPEEEVAVWADSGEGVGPQRIHAPGPILDYLGERVLSGRAFVDRQAPPGRLDLAEGVRDVLAAHQKDASDAARA